MDPALGEDRFVEAKQLSHLLDRVVEIVQRLTVGAGAAQPDGHVGQVPLELGERVTLDLNSRERAALQLDNRSVAVARQDLGLFVLHQTMIARPDRRSEAADVLNLPRVARVAVGRLKRYRRHDYDHLDEAALTGALDQTDDESTDAWFSYPLQGTPPLTVSLAQAVGGSVVSVRVDGDIDPILAQLETLFDLL